MISQNGKKIIERFVSAAKNLLMQNVTEMLQQWYGIWADGHTLVWSNCQVRILTLCIRPVCCATACSI